MRSTDGSFVHLVAGIVEVSFHFFFDYQSFSGFGTGDTFIEVTGDTRVDLTDSTVEGNHDLLKIGGGQGNEGNDHKNH